MANSITLGLATLCIILAVSNTRQVSALQYFRDNNEKIVDDILNVIRSHNANSEKTINDYLDQGMPHPDGNPVNVNSQERLSEILKLNNLEFVRVIPSLHDIRKILVKRKVPLQHVPKMEYDHRMKTLYRPISHHSPPSTLQRYKENFNLRPNKAIRPPFSYQNYYDNNQMSSFKDPTQPQLHLRVSKMKDMEKMIENFGRDINRLQYNLRQANTTVPVVTKATTQRSYTTTTAPALIKDKPDYPFWNYWTYKKQFIDDECPGQQIKLNDQCIWVTPHRRFLEDLGYKPYD